MVVLKALFTDNNHYKKLLIFGDEFVEAISWLYDNAQCDEAENYCLDSQMNMPVLMTAVTYLVETALSPHGKIGVNDLIKKIRRDEHEKCGFKYSIKVVKTEDEICYCYKCLDIYKVEVIIWAAYLYMDIMSHILSDEDKEKYNIKKTILYKVLVEQSGFKESYFIKHHFLWKMSKHTILNFRLELGKIKDKADQYENDNCIKASNEKVMNNKKKNTKEKRKNELVPDLVAEQCVALFHEFGVINNAFKQKEAEMLLSALTGLAPSSFHNMWSKVAKEKSKHVEWAKEKKAELERSFYKKK